MKILLACVLALFAATLVTLPDAEARRFGGGLSLGKQFKSTPRAAPRQSQQAASGRSRAASGAAGRTSGASRWLGPLAGLAAGGLLASLFFGDGFEGLKIMDILLIGALVVGGMMMLKAMRRGSPAPAGSGAYGGSAAGGKGSDQGLLLPNLGAGAAAAPSEDIDEAPSWFDGPEFLEGAKIHFIRLQAAWDQADFRDIREYTTPELYAELQRERQRLGEGEQYTEVVTLEAEIEGVRRDGDRAVASIVFSGLIREEKSAIADPFREIWHVQHDWDSRDGDWRIAGVQQS